MKTAALTIGRNDGYKEDERVLVHLESLLDTFDEVLYIDWNSDDEKGSLLWTIEDKLPKTGRLKHYILPKSIISQLYGGNEGIGAVWTPMAHNVLLRRCNADWIVCTTNDIIAPKKKILNNFIKNANPNSFFTFSRRDFEYQDLVKYGTKQWKEYRDILDKTSEERRFYAKVTPNDKYSIINCCGDFQFAPKKVWDKIRGYEEGMIYACFTDTNVQKKAVLNNFNLEAIYDVPLYHMSHTGMGNDGSSPSKLVYNDLGKWVEYFTNTENDENWGLANLDIECEVI